MTKRRKDPLLEALEDGRSHTWTVPEGGNLASMRKAIKHGQTLTMSPVSGSTEGQVGDLVLVKWHQGDIFHVVGVGLAGGIASLFENDGAGSE